MKTPVLRNAPAGIVLAAWIALVAFPVDAQVKKWVDAKGQVHYGDVPPPEVPTKPVEITPTDGFSQDDVRRAGERYRIEDRIRSSTRERLSAGTHAENARRNSALEAQCAQVRLAQARHHEQALRIRQKREIERGDAIARDAAFEERERWINANCK
jgi:hypothetical protein